MLDRVASGLSADARSRVLVEAAGNPLGLVELPRILPELDDPLELLAPARATLTLRLERAFGARLNGLDQDTCLVLLAAALDGSATIAELLAAAACVCAHEVELSAVDSAAERDLVALHGSELRFQTR